MEGDVHWEGADLEGTIPEHKKAGPGRKKYLRDLLGPGL